MNSLTPSLPSRNRLRINTSNVQESGHASKSSVESATSGNSKVHALPSFRVSVSPHSEGPPKSPSWAEPTPKPNSRARNESRKLLAHVLDKLQSRVKPPSVFDAFAKADASDNSGLGALVETVKDAVKPRGGKRDAKMPSLGATDGLSDDEGLGDQVFSTDTTFDLMSQLKEVLLISAAHGWRIFDDSSSEKSAHDGIRKSASPFRRSRHNLQPLERRSRSSSPMSKGQVQAPELLSLCISVIESVVSEDCRYKIASPRPMCPPNALQALTLDVANFLLHTHLHDPKIVSQIGFALIPAFSTFPSEMHARLLAFFEERIIRGVLEELQRIQGVDKISVPGVGNMVEPMYLDDNFKEPVVSIHVDEAQMDVGSNLDNSTRSSWAPASSSLLELRSTNAPMQPLSLYHLASLTPPLLASILECIDPLSQSGMRVEVYHRFYRLLDLIVKAKTDVYSDILQIVAYHTSKARHSAINILTTFWPKAVGHLVVTKPFFVSTYKKSDSDARMKDHPYVHQFVPWRFISRRPGFDGVSHHDCRSCTKPINEFGLLCPFCMCTVHFDCYDYPEGNHLTQYTMATDPNVQRVAMYRFSTVLQNRMDTKLESIQNQGHHFRVTTLFTLCLCFICRKPLWGCTAQGLKCTSCSFFVHSTCLSTPVLDLPRCGSSAIDSNHINVAWSILRDSCLEFHHSVLSLTKDQLGARSYEEISIFLATLWVQLQIMTSGVALGSIVVIQDGININTVHSKEHEVNEFELHNVIRWCEAYLSSDTLPYSVAMGDYLQDNGLNRSEHSLMFDWSNLTYIATVIKSPYTAEKQAFYSTSSDLLNVAQPDVLVDRTSASYSPFEVISLSHMRNVLGHELHVHSDTGARLILSHLHHLGLFDRLDAKEHLFEGDVIDINLYCTFPLPLGLDLSVEVETLVSAVEACLLDLDLSVNEFGFLLLIRKLWPNGLSSEYVMRRLARNIFSWVLAEDDNLATILRDYLAKQKDLPGVRSGLDLSPWPSTQTSRPAPPSSVNNGGDYVAARRSLLSRYVVQWLLALHDQDPVFYTALIYETCRDTAGHILFYTDTASIKSYEEDNRRYARQCDEILRSIIKLSQASIIFSVFDDLFVRWLEFTSAFNSFEEHLPSLYRLFPRETEASQRHSTILEATQSQSEIFNQVSIDPWRIVMNTAAESTQGLTRSLQWLVVFARSGVDIPDSTFLMFSSLVTECHSPLDESLLLVKAVMSSMWIKSVGRQQLQPLFATLHSRLAPHLKRGLKNGVDIMTNILFIRYSLATCLLLYGCDRTRIRDHGIIKEEDIKNLPSRRKLNIRASTMPDPIIIEPQLMKALGEYIEVNVDEVSCLIAKFFYMFLTDSPFLEPYEVDNFILRNGVVLSACAWHFYSIQSHDISSIRTALLLRILVVDSQPFQSLLYDLFIPSDNWERRLLAVTQLFRIVLDVTSPFFIVDDRQWRSSVIDIFYCFFGAMWADEQEEIRLAADTFASTLLPAHFEAISHCWNESLAKAPILERVKLVSFLIQLRPHFPHWAVLSWETILESLLEDGYDQMSGGLLSSPRSTSMHSVPLKEETKIKQGITDPDMSRLRVAILSLSLRMIADGIAVDNSTLLKIKVHLVQIIGFNRISVIPSTNGHISHVQFGEVQKIPELAFPCVHELLFILDAHYLVDLPPTAMGAAHNYDGKSTLLPIGSIFVDVYLTMFFTIEDLSSLHVSMVKSMLEGICIIIYKHDFNSRALKHLQQNLRRAVIRALEFLSQDISYEILQQALSVVQAFIKRWHSFMGSIVYTSIEDAVKLVASQSHHGQNALLAQAKSYIDTTLTTYADNGLFANLLKRKLNGEFFIILKQIIDASVTTNAPKSLRDALLRDAFSRAVENDIGTFQTVLNNLQSFVEVVYHQNYSVDLMIFVGQHLTHLARRASEYAADVVDPSPLLLIPAILIQHNKAHSREMLSYTDTVLRVALNRLNVKYASLSRLVQVTATLYRKTQVNETVPSANSILFSMFEILTDGLRMKARVLSTTLKAMLDTITEAHAPGTLSLADVYTSSSFGLVESGLYYLQTYIWSDVLSESEFTASLAVAKMILSASRHDSSVVNRLSDHAEKLGRHSLGVRAWNILVLAALRESTEASVFAQLPAFSATNHAVLRGHLSASTLPDSATTDINHAYIAIKLWLMLAHRTEGDNTARSAALMVWNELWPPFEGLLNVLEIEAQAGSSSTVATLISSSVADLFIFLHSLKTPIALQTSAHIATLNRLRLLSRGDSLISKLSRAARSMTEPAIGIPFDILVNQTAKDIVAAEKIRTLEMKRDAGRAPERYRRDARAPL